MSGIAIIGMAGRFPGARTPAELWRNLRAGVESITFFTAEELRRAGVDPELLANPAYVPAKAVVDGVEEFDAGFFGFTPREAELTDPQHRFFLECAWEALEDAAYDPGRYAGKIGLFGGAGVNSYLMLHLLSRPELAESVGLLQTLIHNKNDHLCTRVGYKLDLGGPCVTVQTACSTSLVAVSLACQSLIDYQCDMALAGGSTIVLPQRSGYLYQAGGIASPDGHCRAFDAEAAGTVDGNGTALVVLKRLEDALADGDRIRAVIRGWAINNDGARKAGYTTPSVDRQAEVIALAQGLAEVSPETIGYVEAHGTGTPLGDPVEIEALTRAFRLGTARTGFCALGSIKSNFGHLDTAAGAAGLIKTALALEHGEIPPSLHYRAPNPRTDLGKSPFYVAAELTPWRRGETPRRAGVSSFGIGGTNAHLVLEEAPAPTLKAPEARPWQQLLLSARSTSALEVATEQLAAFLTRQMEAGAESDLAAVAYTLQLGRKRFAHRRVVLCRNVAEAVTALGSLDPERVFTRSQERVERPVIFMFPGQGVQYPGMGARLYATEPFFRRQIDRCAEILAPVLGRDLRQLIYPASEPEGEELHQTRFTQPAVFTLAYALARLWWHWGVVPRAMIGHSIGEYVAACLAGVISLEQALPLVAARGRLMQGLPPGAMLSVALPEKDVLPLLGDELSLAAINGPALSVVAGPEAAVDCLAGELDRAGVTVRRLHVSHAFHSRMMEPILDDFAQEVAQVTLRPPQIPFISNLTGGWISAREAIDPQYWVRHLRATVRFSDGVETLLREAEALFLEVGPGRALKTVTRWHPKKSADQVVETSLPHVGDRLDDDLALHTAVGRLALAGVEVDWERYHGGRRLRVPLPTYPFEHQRYWIDPAPRVAGAPLSATSSLDRKREIADWFYVPVWQEVPPLVAGGDLAGPWLVFLDELGIGAALVALLAERGAAVAVVEPGEEYGVLGGDDHTSALRYRLEPGRADGYRELVADLRRRRLSPQRIIHLWSVTGHPHAGVSSIGVKPWATLQDRVFYSLLFLAQALGAGPLEEGTSLLVVSDGLQSVAGEPAPHPEKAALLGAVKVIPREVPAIDCRSLDLELPPLKIGPRRAEHCAPLLLAEAVGGHGRVSAIRGSRRWIESYQPLRLAPGPAATGLREGGCFLLTGGLGGVGLEVAELLAREAKARLVLLGRSPFPPPEEWDDRLVARVGGNTVGGNTVGDNTVSRKIRRLRRLEQLGARVLTLTADVADEEQLQRAVATARERFGHIDGVFHLAGIAGGGLIQLRTREAARTVFAPKVEGARALERALADDPPELWVFFSSLAGVVGRLGQVDYCAANAFLAAWARDLARRTGARAVAIDWGEWLETGMAASATLGSGAAGDEDAKVETLDHPLLERRTLLASGEEVYATDFNVHKHWVVDEHRLVGNPVIPGVAYIEMVRAAIGERAAGKMLELHDLYFVAPLRVRDDETREVRLRLRPEGEGFSFSIESDADEDEGVAGVREYALGKVRLTAPTPIDTLDLETIKAGCNERVAVFADEEREDDLGPRWQNVQRAYVGRNQVLTHLALPEDFAPDFAVMKYHPSMMDRAAGVAKEYLYQGTYLPLGYKALRIKGPIPRQIYTWARHRPEVDPSLETLTFDTRVMDEEGRVLVEFDSFSQKLVTDAAVKIKSYAGHGDWGHSLTAVAAAAPSALERRSQEMLPEEGAEALHRILAGPPVTQVSVSVRDLAAVIARADESAQDRILEETERQRGSGPARAAHPRPELAAEYLAPRTDFEHRLAAVWEEMLGITPIGVHDDFFELGGDSVLVIQIIAALGKQGVELTPQQFFQHRTLAGLAELAGEAVVEGASDGPFPLTAAQLGWLEAGADDRWTDGRLFVARGALDPGVLARAAVHLVAAHPAFGLRLERAGNGWTQFVAEHVELPFAHCDLTATAGAERERSAAAAAVATRSGLDPVVGPVARLTYLDLGPGEGRILLGLHPLAADAASWAILLADLETLYGQLAEGREPGLPPELTSLRRFAAGEQAAAEASRGELDFWFTQLPAALGAAPNAAEHAGDGEIGVAVDGLDAEETRTLLAELARAYHAGAEEAVLAAFSHALANAVDWVPLAVTVERDARRYVPEGTDLERTVGPLTLAFPLRLPAGADIGGLLKAAKEALRRPAAGGAGFGRLRYLAAGEPQKLLAARPLPAIGFHCSEVWPAGGILTPEPAVPELAADRLLALFAQVDDGGLRLCFGYRPEALSAAAGEALAKATATALRALLDHCRTLTAESFTPSDFPLAELDDDALAQLMSLVGDADDDPQGDRG